jgi:hypothetical protein
MLIHEDVEDGPVRGPSPPGSAADGLRRRHDRQRADHQRADNLAAAEFRR